jgi:hypothetical protein
MYHLNSMAKGRPTIEGWSLGVHDRNIQKVGSVRHRYWPPLQFPPMSWPVPDFHLLLLILFAPLPIILTLSRSPISNKTSNECVISTLY